MKHRILIVEDDRDLGNLLRQYLELNGFEVTRVFDGLEARTILQTQSYHILIVDVMMPNEDGFTLALHLKEHYPDQHFLFVTARNRQEDILHGLRLGAGDYITKPFDADELILRVNNIIRRIPQNQASDEYAIGIFRFQPRNLLLISPDEEKSLTEKEAALLHYLYTHRNELIVRHDVLIALWGESDFFKGRSLDVFISRLRKYLLEDTTIRIDSIRGAGFRFTIN